MRNRILLAILTLCAIIGSAIFIYRGIRQTNASTQAGSSAYGDVILNEVMASNPDAIPDEEGHFYDWIELYNQGDNDVDLSQWGLSDRTSEPRWYFPQGTTLPAKSYLIVYCAGKDANSRSQSLYASVKLNASKDTAVLFSANSRIVDQLPLFEIAPGASIGRLAENPQEWIEQEKPTPGFANSPEGRTAYEATLVGEPVPLLINEIQAKNVTTLLDADGERPDWIEFYHSGNAALDIGGFGLSDELSKPMKWVFPKGTVIQPNSHFIVFCSGDTSKSTPEALHADFKLASYQGAVYLSNQRAQVVQEVAYDEIPVDQSYARNEDGSWSVHGVPTPYLANTEQSTEEIIESAAYGKGNLIISEVMLYNDSYAEDEDETHHDWIEIQNRSAQTLDLSGYGLSDNAANPAKWRFPPETTIDPGEHKIIMASGTLERDADAKKKYLHVNYQLSNAKGELLTLWDARDQLLDRMVIPTQHRSASYGRGQDGRLGYFQEPTPAAANAALYRGYAAPASLSLQSGFYDGAQTISLALTDDAAGGVIHYTLDGSEPSANDAAYQSPISIEKTGVLRARVFPTRDDLLPSEIATGSYIIDNPHNAALSIVSIAGNPKDFFDATEGIYAKGSNASDTFPYKGANFWKRDWEKPTHVDIFSPDGTHQIGQDLAIRIFGAYSRGMDQKGFALIARSTYGDDRIHYPVFEDRPYESYKSLVLRASAQDAIVTKLHDIVATSLAGETGNLEVQAYRQAVVYLNGDYFGIYNIREKITRNWIADHYGLKDPENVDVLFANGRVLHGDSKAYDELTAFCEENDLAAQENYEKVKTMMDVDNYIDYLIAEMYVMNTDTGNIKWFRERSDDPDRSKFRWIYYDFCWGFIYAKRDPLAYWTNPEGHGVGKGFSTLLPRSLFQNQEFRDRFLTRSAELLNTVYEPAHVLARVEECEARIIDEIPRDTERWPFPLDDDRTAHSSPENSAKIWKSNVRHMKEFAQTRKGYMITHIANFYDLNEEETIAVFGEAGTPVE